MINKIKEKRLISLMLAAVFITLLLCASFVGAELFLVSKRNSVGGELAVADSIGADCNQLDCDLSDCYRQDCVDDATVQATFGSQELESLWYYGADALNIGAAKQIASGWDRSRLAGDPIVIAVIDTGLDVSHPIFDGVLYLDDNGDLYGYNSYTGSYGTRVDLSDSSSDKHGNGVAGVMTMLIKELGLQDYIKIYPIKANSTGKSSFAIGSVTRAINWATDTVGADVINLSLGLLQSDMKNTDWVNDSQLKYAVSHAAQNSLIVAAAGNNSLSSAVSDNKFYPAAMNGVLSVMSYGRNLDVYSTSNYGSAYDIAAPGESIYTAGSALGTQYKTMTGTSVATPIASVASALIKLRYRAEGKAEPSGYDLSMMMRNLDVGSVTDRDGGETDMLNLYTVLSQDFENTIYDYASPIGIEISHNGTLGADEYADAIYMRANKVQPVSFIARIMPFGYTNPEFEQLLEWVLVDSENNEIVLGSGTNLEYTAEAFGDTKLVAKLSGFDISESQDVHIQYLEYYPGSFKVTYLENGKDSARIAPTSGVLYTSETTVFTATWLQYMQPDTVRWYVNGEYKASGNTFAFKPTTPGDYRISAQYGDHGLLDYEGYAFTAHVRSFILRPLDFAVLMIFIVIFVLLIGAAIVIYKRRKDSKKMNAVTANDSGEE